MEKKQRLLNAIKKGKVKDDITLAIFEMIDEMTSNIESEKEKLKKDIEEAVRRIEDLNPTNQKYVALQLQTLLEKIKGENGEDGKDYVITEEDINSIVEKVKSLIPIPKDGKDGKDGKNGRNGIDGIDGKDADETSIIEKSAQRVLETIVIPTENNETIINKINEDGEILIKKEKIEGAGNYDAEIATLQNRTQLLNQIASGALRRIEVLELDDVTDFSRFLKTDQTTPQTIINGIPLLEETRVIDGIHQIVDKSYVDGVAAAYVPYTGATDAVNLGSQDLTTTGLATLGSIKSGILYPSADSTTAVQIRKANGTTAVVNFDTTNSRVGIGANATGPVRSLEIVETGSGAEVIMFQIRNNATANDTASTLRFVNSTSGAAVGAGVELSAIRTNTTNAGASDFVIRTSTTTSTMVDRLRVSSVGSTTLTGTSFPILGITRTLSSSTANAIYGGQILELTNSGTKRANGISTYFRSQDDAGNSTNIGLLGGILSTITDTAEVGDIIINPSFANSDPGTSANLVSPAIVCRAVTASTSYVGIQNANPLSELDVARSSRALGPTIRLTNSANSQVWEAGNALGNIDFVTTDATTPSFPIRGRMSVVAGSGNTNTYVDRPEFVWLLANAQAEPTELMRLGYTGNLGIGIAIPTAVLHLKAGTATASTAPLKLTSGTSLTNAEAGAIEYTTDDLFFTIATDTARKRLLMADAVGGLTSGKIPVATTNGRLADLTAQATEEALKADYTEGDLDSEAEIIAAINATNTKINSIITKLKTLGLLASS
jgi:hypothetical protein